MRDGSILRTIVCSLALLLVVLSTSGQETSLMPAGDPLAAGWRGVKGSAETPAILDWQAGAGKSGGGCFHIRAGDMGSKAIGWKAKIKAPEGVQALQFSVWIRGKEVQGAWMVTSGLSTDPSKDQLDATTFKDNLLKGSFDWTLVQATLPLRPDVHELRIGLYLYWSGEVWFDGLTMRPAERPANFQENGAGLIEVKGSFRVEAVGKEGGGPKILFPLPSSYGVQVPLTFRLWTEPASGLIRSRVYEDAPGNWIYEARIAKVEPGKPIGVRWSSIVLCAPDPVRTLPKTIPFPAQWPKEVRPWLKSTYLVESADPRFVAIAKNILSKSNDLLAVIHEADHESNTIQAKGSGEASDQRSTTALTKAVDCTGNANRLAAILRACNIPARVMACYLTGIGPHQTHYEVEVYIPAEGWMLVDSLFRHWHGFDQVMVSAVTPENEERAKDRCPDNPSGGVPYLSIHESPGCNGDFRFLGDLGSYYADHLATQWRLFPSDATSADWESALKESRLAWQKWLGSAKRWHKGAELMTPLAQAQLEKADLANLPDIVHQSEVH